MKARHIPALLLAGAVWGLAEALLGGWLYSDAVREAAPRLAAAAPVLLAGIAFAVLTAARAAVPVAGSSAAVAALAMLFKLLNQPFFACHLLAILLLGVGFDAAFSLARGRAKPLIGLVGTYLGFALFALTITYVVRYPHWAAGWPKVLRYVGLKGTAAAACNALVVPLVARAARGVGEGALGAGARRWAVRGASAAAAALWAFAAVHKILLHAG